MMKNNIYKIAAVLLFTMLLSCEKSVEDGYRIDYPESATAQLSVDAKDTLGSINDTIKFSISAKSESELKSIVISTSISGSGGSGFTIPSGSSDPLIDHSFGTIQKGTKEFKLIYNYIVTQDTVDPVITFKIIDASGMMLIKRSVLTVPSIKSYPNISLFTHTGEQTDGYATVSNSVYRDLSQYSSESDVNKLIQKSLDIIFVIENNQSWLIAPYDWRFGSSSSTFVRNKTRFKIIQDLNNEDFDSMTSARLYALIKTDSIKQKGETAISVKKGTIAAFFTDYASANSYKAGLVRIKAVHPSYCTWYSGDTYQIDIDIISQISK